MVHEGTIEPGRDTDVLESVPCSGACHLEEDGGAVHVRMEAQALSFTGDELFAVTTDPIDPRVVLFVVEHEGHMRTLRFRSRGQPAQIISMARWMIANAYDPNPELQPEPDCPLCADLWREQRATQPRDPRS